MVCFTQGVPKLSSSLEATPSTCANTIGVAFSDLSGLMLTIVGNQRRNEFTIPTRELYEAHLKLTPHNISNSTVAPFISLKKNISPAAAVLHNVMGQGPMLRKLFEA